MAVLECREQKSVSGHVVTLVALLGCAFAGFVCASSPQLGLGLLLCGMVACASLVVLGGTGLFILIPVGLSFVLLNRFDELLAIPIGERRITAVYWVAIVCVGVLVVVMQRSNVSRNEMTVTDKFLPQFKMGLLLLMLVGVVSIGLNGLFDEYVPNRSILGEMLALGAIGVPMCFAVLIPTLTLSKERALMYLRAFVALGGATGLVMIVFGLAPAFIINLLGWVKAPAGTLDLARGRTPLGHPNTVGAVLVLLLPVAVIMGFRSRGLRWRPFYLVSATLIFCSIFFTLSRSALAVMAPMLLLSLGYAFLAGQKNRIAGRLLPVLFAIVLTGVAVSLFCRYDFSRFWSRGYFEDASVERRVQSMTTALAAWRDYPLFGAGPDSVYPRVELRPEWVPQGKDHISDVIVYRGRISALNPHNLYLTVLAEFGTVGGAALLWLLGLVGLTILRARRSERLDAADRAIVTALGLGFLGFLLYGMTGALFLYNIRPGIIFWAFIGLTIRYVAVVTRGPIGQKT